MPRKIAAGNWKMNGLAADLQEVARLGGLLAGQSPTVVICPPAPLLYRAHEVAAPHGIQIGAQNCHNIAKGAHTGDISAEMIADTGADFVILGHSERRESYAETNRDVRSKAKAAWAAGLTAILCIGETGEDRAANNTLDIIGGQLAGSLPNDVSATNTVVAYEPVWAIGTGKVPSLAEIVEVHDFIRARLIHRFGAAIGADVPLLYGGSVKPENAAEIFRARNVDGALVGGASLKAADFAPIVAALNAS